MRPPRRNSTALGLVLARVAIALLPCVAGRAAAQDTAAVAHPPMSVGAWGGLANNSPTHIWGTEGGRDIAVVAVRLAWPIHASPAFTWEYVLDLVPGAWVSMPRRDSLPGTCDKPQPGGCEFTVVQTRMGRAHAIGLAPLGFQLRFGARERVQPYLAISGGMLRFREQIPVRDGAQLNFTADGGTGVFIALPRGLQLLVGYKFYHISNAWTAPQNPGLDGHMFVLGLNRGAR